MTWKLALQIKPFKNQLIGIILLLLVFLFSVPWYFTQIVEPRPGTLMNDLLLNLFLPADHSTLIFILIYGAIGQSIISLAAKPDQLLLCLTAYCTMNYVRVTTLWLFPLEPPVGIIPLNDPIIEKIVYGGKPLLKDLFFSGHVATLSILAMVEKNRIWSIVKWAMTIVLGLLLMHQRVHYTVDVLFGVIVSVMIIRLVKHPSIAINRFGKA